jgi:hypothetical protein
MIKSCEVLLDGFARVREVVHEVVRDLTPEQLTWRPDARANPVGWLVWHLARVQDSQLAGVLSVEEVWTSGGWAARFGLPLDVTETGYGQRPSEIASLAFTSTELLTGYLDAVSARTADYLADVTDADLDHIADESYSPPVTLGTRLVSVLADDLQHAGQAAYVVGMVHRR